MEFKALLLCLAVASAQDPSNPKPEATKGKVKDSLLMGALNENLPADALLEEVSDALRQLRDPKMNQDDAKRTHGYKEDCVEIHPKDHYQEPYMVCRIPKYDHHKKHGAHGSIGHHGYEDEYQSGYDHLLDGLHLPALPSYGHKLHGEHHSHKHGYGHGSTHSDKHGDDVFGYGKPYGLPAFDEHINGQIMHNIHNLQDVYSKPTSSYGPLSGFTNQDYGQSYEAGKYPGSQVDGGHQPISHSANIASQAVDLATKYIDPSLVSPPAYRSEMDGFNQVMSRLWPRQRKSVHKRSIYEEPSPKIYPALPAVPNILPVSPAIPHHHKHFGVKPQNYYGQARGSLPQYTYTQIPLHAQTANGISLLLSCNPSLNHGGIQAQNMQYISPAVPQYQQEVPSDVAGALEVPQAPYTASVPIYSEPSPVYNVPPPQQEYVPEASYNQQQFIAVPNQYANPGSGQYQYAQMGCNPNILQLVSQGPPMGHNIHAPDPASYVPSPPSYGPNQPAYVNTYASEKRRTSNKRKGETPPALLAPELFPETHPSEDNLPVHSLEEAHTKNNLKEAVAEMLERNKINQALIDTIDVIQSDIVNPENRPEMNQSEMKTPVIPKIEIQPPENRRRMMYGGKGW